MLGIDAIQTRKHYLERSFTWRFIYCGDKINQELRVGKELDCAGKIPFLA